MVILIEEIDMNYKKIYEDFIKDRKAKEPDQFKNYGYRTRGKKSRVIKKVYYEHHHIVPRSLGGSDDKNNIVALELKDHFLAHYYLAEIHGGTQWYAVIKMIDFRATKKNIIKKNVDNYKKIYEKARKNYLLVASDRMKGKKNPSAGKIKEKNPNSRKFLCVETKKIFNSARECKEWCGVEVNRACSHGILAGGYHWKRLGNASPLTKNRPKIDLIQSHKTGGLKRTGKNNPKARSILCLETKKLLRHLLKPLKN